MSEEENPMRRAQAAMRAQLPKRFYKEAAAAEAPGGFAILLDGRPAKTPAKKSLLLPNRKLAEAVAAEWAAIDDVVDPVELPLTRLANLAIDAIALAPQPVIDEIVQYAGTDLVFYRAEEPEGLVAAQAEQWDRIVGWAEQAFGARLVLAAGIVHAKQSEQALGGVRRIAETLPRPFGLAAAASATNLSGSALIALALAEGALGADEAWNAAHVDEQWNISQWGEDAEAQRRLAARHREFTAAATMLALLRK